MLGVRVCGGVGVQSTAWNEKWPKSVASVFPRYPCGSQAAWGLKFRHCLIRQSS